MTQQAEYILMAAMDTSRPIGGNAIHSDQGAKDYGFQSALVVGGYVYAWAVPAILEVLGTSWMTRGWIEIHFRRPVYVGDELIASASAQSEGHAEVTVRRDGEKCLVAEAGTGDAPWLSELVVPTNLNPEARPEQRPPLTLENAPVGRDLRPSSSRVTEEGSVPYVGVVPETDSNLWSGPGALVHPAWVVGRMTGLQLHSYTFSPSIAAVIRVQHLAPFHPNQQITTAGHFRDAYERNGHHYSVVDGLILGEDGAKLMQIQQRTIFKVAKRG